MTANDIIMQGEEAKYFVDITHEGFDMETDDFEIELRYGLMGKSIKLTKQDMTADSSGKYFFQFDTSGIVGKVTAVCTYKVPDTDDVDDSERTKVDEQLLCFIATTPCPRLIMCPACEQSQFVSYERTDSSGIASIYQRLCTTLGQPIVTDDDLYLYVLTETQNS